MESSNSFNSARIKGKYEELYHKIGLKIAVDGGKAVHKISKQIICLKMSKSK